MNVNIDGDVELMVRWLTFLPLIVCSVISVALIISKWLDLRPRHILSPEQIEELKALIAAGQASQVAERADEYKTHASQLVSRLVAYRGLSRDALMARGAQAGDEIAQQMEYGLGGLALIALLGPLFGLLGTVVGIVVVFQVLALAEGAASPQELAGGIGTALYTTIAGLIVGIIALVAHRALKGKATRATSQLETTGLDIVDLLTGEKAPEVEARAAASMPIQHDELADPVKGNA